MNKSANTDVLHSRFKYRVYYRKEQQSSGKGTEIVEDTLMQDRDKMVTYDWARLEYMTYGIKVSN